MAETLAGQAQPGRAEVLDRLRAARALALEAEDLERQAWADAREQGLSWAQLGEAVGITRSGAQQRHRQLTTPSKRPAPSRSNQTHPGRP